MRFHRAAHASLCLLLVGIGSHTASWAVAQAPVAAKSASASQRGTVKTISGNSFTVTTDAGALSTITVSDTARIVQVAPGSTDLKAAQTIVLTDIGVGDKVLVTGKSGDTPEAFTATRVILMKSGDIAQKRAAEQADWQKRGVGGIVNANDGAGTLTISSGAKKIQVHTGPATIFRRYASDSIKFEDAKPGTLAQIQTGDQFEVRGAKSDDGTSMQADEVVSGSFRNLSGTLAGVNTAAGTITLKDLATKKMITVTITANSDVRKLPPELAARFAARQRGGDATATAAGAVGGARPIGAPSGPPPAGGPPAGSRGPGGPGGYPGPGGGGASGRSAGMDLSKMLSRLPTSTLADLKTGDAVMIVASQTQPGSDLVTAVTLLAGVDAILAATPSGSPAMTLSPWNVGGGAPEGGGGTP